MNSPFKSEPYLCWAGLFFAALSLDKECNVWLCTRLVSAQQCSPQLHRPWRRFYLELQLPTQLIHKEKDRQHALLHLFYPWMICLHVQVPDAVAGPTPLSLHNSVIAAWTSGNKLNALLVKLWTASSLFEPISCCKRGRNFPFWDRTGNCQKVNCALSALGHNWYFFLSDVITSVQVTNERWHSPLRFL